MITQEELKTLLDYNADTGLFTYKTQISRRTKPGSVAMYIDDQGYVRVGIKGKQYKGHRLAWFYTFGEWPVEDIDHINRNKADNRLCNLRKCEHWKNLHNASAKKHNRTGYKGVVWYKNGEYWTGRITIKGNKIHLGVFDTPEEAHIAYCFAAIEMLGDFAYAA